MGPVPEETARLARAAYPKGNSSLQLRDTLGTIYEDEQFADVFPSHGQPAQTPWRLALVCVMQFLEGLSDRQAASVGPWTPGLELAVRMGAGRPRL